MKLVINIKPKHIERLRHWLEGPDDMSMGEVDRAYDDYVEMSQSPLHQAVLDGRPLNQEPILVTLLSAGDDTRRAVKALCSAIHSNGVWDQLGMAEDPFAWEMVYYICGGQNQGMVPRPPHLDEEDA